MTVAESDTYTGYYQDVDSNVLLLNNFDWGPVPFHGAVSDVNIWSRVLTEEEILSWSLCERDISGKVLSWEESILNITLVTEETIDRQRMCFKPKTGSKMVGFRIKKSFDETVRFCQSIGGNISVARDQKTVDKIVEIFTESCAPDTEIIHSGYSDTNSEGVWVDVVTGQSMKWIHWADLNPTNYTHEDCAFYNMTERAFFDGFCSKVFVVQVIKRA